MLIKVEHKAKASDCRGGHGFEGRISVSRIFDEYLKTNNFKSFCL